MNHSERSGFAEYITKSWEGGDRPYQGYVCIVQIPGYDTVEVGLGEIRKKMGWSQLTTEKVALLMGHKPAEMISFSGPNDNLQISEFSAEKWVNAIKGE